MNYKDSLTVYGLHSLSLHTFNIKQLLYASSITASLLLSQNKNEMSAGCQDRPKNSTRYIRGNCTRLPKNLLHNGVLPSPTMAILPPQTITSIPVTPLAFSMHGIMRI